MPVGTDWLNKYLKVAGESTEQFSAKVSSAMLLEYWSPRLIADRDTVCKNLAHFGKLLAQARELRRENNYEALLIAHEYRHDLGESFTSLSASMDKAALFALRFACNG